MRHTVSKLKVGAIVRFLNTKGGGQVTRIIGDTVWVEDEDGFEIPTLARECVVVEKGDTFMPAHKRPKLPQAPQSFRLVEERRQTDRSTFSEDFTPPKPHSLLSASGSVNAYLAFLPMDAKALGNTNYEAYLINDSKYTLFYTYSSREATRWRLRSSGLIDPDSQLFLEEFAPREINSLEQLNLQLVAFANNPQIYQGTYSIELRLDARKFFKINTFEENEFFDEGAWIETLVEESKARKLGRKLDPSQIAEAMKTSPRKEGEKNTPDKYQAQSLENDPLVVNLHIEALLDDTTGMNNAAILRYQLDKFNEVMQANLKYQGRKIIFIHGKGEGVLRNKIEGELKYRYTGFIYQDASFKEYSYGATQVTIGELKKRRT